MSEVYKTTFYIGSGKRGKQLFERMQSEAIKRDLVNREGEPALGALLFEALMRYLEAAGAKRAE